MRAADVEHPAVVRLDRRKLTRHACDSLFVGRAIHGQSFAGE
jgi:hypothetical protein